MHSCTPRAPPPPACEMQLRDDLLSMLVAGHETTGSALTWTLYLLAQNPDKMRKVRAGAGVGVQGEGGDMGAGAGVRGRGRGKGYGGRGRGGGTGQRRRQGGLRSKS